MAMPASERNGQRYVGDSERRLVHDSLHEDPTPGGCQLRVLFKSGSAVRFEPDRMGQATSEGFMPCPRCFYRLEDRPGRAMDKLTS